jgi:putative transferase (TIGR04331 family)
MNRNMKHTLDFLQLDFLPVSKRSELGRLEGFGLDRKDEIYAFVRGKIENHLQFLTNSLNEVLGVQKPKRFWRISLGHWFSTMTQLCYFRYEILTRLLGLGVVSGNPQDLFQKYLPFLSIASTGQFTDAYVSPAWNRWMSHFAVQLLTPGVFEIGDFEKPFTGSEARLFQTRPKGELIRSDELMSLATAGKRLGRSSRVVIYKSYLDRKVNILLHLRLGIRPRVIRVPLPADSEPNPWLRIHFHKLWSAFCKDDFDRFLAACAVMIFPRSFLEAFAVNHSALRPILCRRGDIVFTSNGFDMDDLFQLFSAMSVENGAKYIIGQHGNGYCSSRHCYTQDEISKIADYFLTWGLRGAGENSIPTFNFKYPAKKLSSKPTGPILVLLHRPPSPMFMWDRYKEDQIYLESIRKILEKLDHKGRSDVIIRYHRNFNYYGGDTTRLAGDFQRFKWDDGTQRLNDISQNCSLIIHTYHSTGILETLNQDIPTLAFWPCGWELLDEAKNDYSKLESVKILHHSVDSLFAEIKAASIEPQKWWNDTERVKVVRDFCDQYSRQSKQAVRDLSRIFKSVINHTDLAVISRRGLPSNQS